MRVSDQSCLSLSLQQHRQHLMRRETVARTIFLQGAHRLGASSLSSSLRAAFIEGWSKGVPLGRFSLGKNAEVMSGGGTTGGSWGLMSSLALLLKLCVEGDDGKPVVEFDLELEEEWELEPP